MLFLLFSAAVLVAEVIEDILAAGFYRLTLPLGALILPAVQLLSVLHASKLRVRWEEY